MSNKMAGTVSLEPSVEQIEEDLVSTVLTEPIVEQGGETLESTVQTTVAARKNHKNLIKSIERDVGSFGYPGKKEFYNYLLILANHFGIYKQDAEDCVQEYLINLIRRGVPSYKHEIKKDATIMKDTGLKPYLFVGFCNHCKDFLRRKQRNKEIPMSKLDKSEPGTRENDYEISFGQIAANTATPEELVSRSQDYERVHMALAHLNEKHREIITLAYFNHFSYDQMSMIIGIPMGTVKSRLHSAVENLKRAYEHLDF